MEDRRTCHSWTAIPPLTKQVFQNLLSNALKFTRGRALQRSSRSDTSRHNGDPTIFVRDNGVGFSMKYADKLFGVFQRLHRDEDFEGTGVGLATVQRIVQKHGGRVWAEAELDKGADFLFHPGASKAAAKPIAIIRAAGESEPDHELNDDWTFCWWMTARMTWTWRCTPCGGKTWPTASSWRATAKKRLDYLFCRGSVRDPFLRPTPAAGPARLEVAQSGWHGGAAPGQGQIRGPR